MSIANYTSPFLAPAPATYLNTQNFGTGSQAAAINSLLYDTPRYTQRQSYIPSSPNRRQPLNSRKVKDNRDPFRNQHPQKTRFQTVSSQTSSRKKNQGDYDDYYSESEHESQKNGHSYSVSDPPQIKRQGGTSNSNGKIKRKLPAAQQQGQQSAQQPNQGWPHRPPTYKRIANTFNSVPEPGAKTSLHAVLDFDDDFEDYSYEDEDIEPVSPSLQRNPKPQVTPIEGPILIKNGSVPVVPLYSYPIVNNGTLVQIPVSISVTCCRVMGGTFKCRLFCIP